jgi:hypothetical protein
MNLNLFLAGMWIAAGIGIMIWPDVGQDAVLRVEPERRFLIGGFALVLAGYNLVRWRLARLRARAEHEARQRSPVRRYPREEPPNPDFDFSDPKPRDGGGSPP